MKIPILRFGEEGKKSLPVRRVVLYLAALASLIYTVVQVVKGNYQKATFFLLLTFWLEYTADN